MSCASAFKILSAFGSQDMMPSRYLRAYREISQRQTHVFLPRSRDLPFCGRERLCMGCRPRKTSQDAESSRKVAKNSAKNSEMSKRQQALKSQTTEKSKRTERLKSAQKKQNVPKSQRVEQQQTVDKCQAKRQVEKPKSPKTWESEAFFLSDMLNLIESCSGIS